jgi:imidazolonepropionase-like amidohydrolase
MILFTNVNVLDCGGDAPFPGEVLVAGTKIARVSPRGNALPRQDAQVVDGGGAYLMPGLVESHVHIGLNNSDDIFALAAVPPEEHTLLAARNARFYLEHGFTSCISAGSVKPRLDIVIRNAVKAGEIPGPRLLASTPWLTVTGGLIDVNLFHMKRDAIALVVDGPENYRRVVREMIREGVDTVKLIVSGDTGIPHAPSRSTVMSEEEIAMVAQEVHCRGRRMGAHARSAGAVKLCVRHGVKVIYHATFADEEALDMLEANRDRLFVSPNIGFTAAALKNTAAQGDAGREAHAIVEEELEAATRSIAALRRRGVPILGGGDYGFASTPHGENAKDIEYFVKFFGFTPMEAIQTMTKHGGAAMGLAEPLGQVKEGFLADLLLVEGNPLDDVRLLQDRSRFLGIMKDGQFHKAPPRERPSQPRSEW